MNGLQQNIVCTIYEKDYAYGLGALLNSLVNAGYSGKIIALYGDNLPFWISQLSPVKENQYLVSDNTEIEFRKLEYDLHLSSYKPYLLSNLLDEFPQSNVFYFDPDITVTADWKFFEDWVDCGVALCLDQSYPLMPVNHPIKKMWQDTFLPLEVPALHPNNYYINSGFIGIHPAHKSIIEVWKNFTTYLKDSGHSFKVFGPSKRIYQKKSRLNAFCSDQDVLNASLIFSDVPLSIVGQEGMGFTPAGYLMNHNTGIKTWRKTFIKQFLKSGQRFTETDQSYFDHSYQPINLYSKKRRFIQKTDKLLTKFCQRIF